MPGKFNRYGSKIILAIILLIVISVNLNLSLWKHEKKIIYWDIVSYYAYLPATFIYHDISLQFTKTDEPKVRESYIFWPEVTEDNKLVIKTTMGLSFMYAPFFFAGHLYALNSSFDAGGFSEPYKIALILSAIFWLALGLVFQRKILRNYFDEVITSIVLVLLVMGTNLFYYSTVEPTMAHVYNFSLFSIFIWFTISWYESPSFKNSIILGLTIGLITLIRPTNVIVVIFSLFYGVHNYDSFLERIRFYIRKWDKLLFLAIPAFLILVPQLLYWKSLTGDWLYYSYGSDERFFWSQPHIIDGLFSYRKGWLIYTPIMLFSLTGIYWLKDKLKVFRSAVLIFVILNVYIIFSWWSWWYGGSFGLRALIDSYAILSIPLAAFIRMILKQNLHLKVSGMLVVFLFFFYSLFATAQYYHGSIHPDGMTKEAYWDSFGRIRPSSKFYELIKTPDYDAAMLGEEDY